MNFRRGFTLIELLVVIAIIGIISGIIFTAIADARKAAYDTMMSENFRILKNNIIAHELEYGTYMGMCDVNSVVYKNIVGIAASAGKTPTSFDCHVNGSQISNDMYIWIFGSNNVCYQIDTTGGQWAMKLNGGDLCTS